MKKSVTSLANVLFPKVRQQVLGLLFVNPEKSFYTNEIIRFTKSGTGVVQRELEKFTSSGLIKVDTIGRQKRYQANIESPLFSEIRSLIVKTFGVADVVKQALASLADEIKIAFIYGSLAKQEDTSSSDIGLMLISDSLSYTQLFPLLEPCQAQLGREINPTCYSTKEWSNKKTKHNNFIRKVLEQPKIFLIGTEDELKQLG